jgi:hypothetical protein
MYFLFVFSSLVLFPSIAILVFHLAWQASVDFTSKFWNKMYKDRLISENKSNASIVSHADFSIQLLQSRYCTHFSWSILVLIQSYHW